ncbi:MAG: PEP/pyruvate-binding domain-containing protein [Syntrophobacteraceae bacterium]|nr:PEP/pyruvate-binding domain-containing protein [Syntrophobacteraceae bacterium]
MKDLIRAYRLYHKLMRHPHLLDEVRQVFLDGLTERGILDEGALTRQILELVADSGDEPGPETIHEYRNAAIDILFAQHFNDSDIENHINLARKRDAFRNLQRVVNAEGVTSADIRRALKELTSIPQGSLHLPPEEVEGVRVALIDHFISSQLPFIGIAKQYITLRDVDEMLDNSHWTPRRSGKIGGKSAGLLMARCVVLPRLSDKDPDIQAGVTVPESHYFSSGILADFIDYNRFYSLHSQKYKTGQQIEDEYGKMAAKVEKAAFPPDIMEDFRSFLGEVGEHPLIVRSSSLLEDNIGYAFSGKYESVFVVNQGDLETRTQEFVRAYKRVFVSVFSPAAILYRRDHNLLDFDERMSVLVQKVVGRRFGDYFYPFAGGVAFSQNMHLWTPRIRREEGLVRIVLGLGTRAVDRVEPDYPRMIALSHPTLRPEVAVQQVVKYSQRMVDVLNLKTRRLETLPYHDLFQQAPHPEAHLALSVVEEDHLASLHFRGQAIPLENSCITFDGFFAQTPFVALMRRILKKLEGAYGRPVDVELAWDDDRLYILQCRSLAGHEDIGQVTLPRDVASDDVLFTNRRAVGNCMTRDIEYVVYVDPRVYQKLRSYEERLAAGRAVGRLNRLLKGRRYALFGPSRWGTNDVNVGVKVGYEDINHALILAEIAFEEGGVNPEVSYGTHFFNDLVEARITPVAIFPDEPETVFDEAFFRDSPNVLSSLTADWEPSAEAVKVIHVPSCRRGQFLHVYQDSRSQEGMGFFGPAHAGDSAF